MDAPSPSTPITHAVPIEKRSAAVRTNYAARMRRIGRKGADELSPAARRAVKAYQRALETGDRKALLSPLRDKRYDVRIRRYLQAGIPVPKSVVRTLVSYYQGKRKLLADQAEEKLAKRQGRAAQFRSQWEERLSLFPRERRRTVKTWRTQNDNRVRPDHAEMEGMTIPFDEMFLTGDQGFVWGPPGVAFNCRCYLEVRTLEKPPTIRSDGTVRTPPKLPRAATARPRR